MEPLTDSRNISRDRTVSGPRETTCAPHTQHGTKLQDILMSDKPNISYADFHRELTRNPDAPLPKYIGSQRSQVLERSNLKEEELVRYMSNLPSYLERGKHSQERALNVGVLDWKRLEKWRYSQTQIPPKHSGHSPSSSNTSLFSTDGSSTHSSRGQSCSPGRQRLPRTNMQSLVEASPKEGRVRDSKSFSGRIPQEIAVFGGNTNKFQDSVATTGNRLGRQYVSDMGRKSIPDNYEGAATWKGKKKIQDVESTKESGRSKETKLNAADRDCSVRDKSGVIIMPRDPMEHTSSSFSGSASFTPNDRLSVEPGEKFLLARNKPENRRTSSSGICNNLEPNLSCSQNESTVQNSSQVSHISLQSTTKKLPTPSSIRVDGIKVSSEMPPRPARILSSPSRVRHTQEKKPVKPSGELDAMRNSEPITKARNPSPIRRLSFAMGKMMKNVGSRDNSPLRRSNAKDCIANSSSDAPHSSLFTDNPCGNHLTINNVRGRPSPLRRLLDPLRKPRVSNCSEPPNKQTSSSIDTLKSRLDSRPGHSIDVNLRSGPASDAMQSSKTVSSTLQALLQISFKNGLPLLTFAIDNEKKILAATVRKSNAPGKGHYNWIYTFFAINEVKRKSGSWLNHGAKSSNPGIVPNVVAQMKVFDSCSSSSIKHETADEVVSREFDLFAVDVSQGDECPTDFQPTNELAAIIVKLPQITPRNNTKVDTSSYDWLDISQGSPRENSQTLKSNDLASDDTEFDHSLLNLNLSTTVILPGGVHTVPSKGEISSLVQRWRSGGLCDCGGWDLGCQLRVYTHKKEDGKLQLFSQVGQDTQPILSLTPFKERICSVEFSSSLSLLQAFAVSVSFIDCRRPPALSEPSNVPEKVTAEVTIRSRMSNQTEAPGRYVSYPPHSPVERV